MAGKLTVEVLTATVGKDGAKLWEKAETASIKGAPGATAGLSREVFAAGQELPSLLRAVR